MGDSSGPDRQSHGTWPPVRAQRTTLERPERLAIRLDHSVVGTAHAEEIALVKLLRMSTSPRIRSAARAIVMDRDKRILLVHFAGGDEPGLANGWWACPGGGIDPGETVTQGLIRELDEELGLRIDDPGSAVWRKQHLFPMTHWDGQQDTYFLIEVEVFEPRPRYSPDELRAEGLDDLRWWTHDELIDAQATYDAGDPTAEGYAVFSPHRLADLLANLLESGRPTEPILLEGR